jgi:HEAT repeat protein
MEILRRRPVWGVLWAAGLLGELKETRAVPLIVDVIKDLRPDAFHESEYVAQHVPYFGQVGVDALIALLQDGEATVRRRAVAGLMYANDARVADALRPLLRDPDSSVWECAERVLLVFEASPARHKKQC